MAIKWCSCFTILFIFCFNRIHGATLFQSYDSIPDFIAEKADPNTRTVLMRFGQIYGIQIIVETDNDRFNVTTITTNGLVLAKTVADTAHVHGHTIPLNSIEKCYVSADDETLKEFLYIFDAKFRTVDTTDIVFLTEIPESEISDVGINYAAESSSYSSSGNNDIFNSSTGSSNEVPDLKPTTTAWSEWNLRNGVGNQIPLHLQNAFDTLLSVTDHCVLTENRWEHVRIKFELEESEPNTLEKFHQDTNVTNELNRARRTPGIFPGTVWCGLGDAATSFDDLGEHNDTDVCCREHDFCPTSITSLRSKFGHFNLRLYTINHCDCDTRLRQCFRSVNTTISSSVAHLFFNVFAPVCFQLESYETCIAKTWWGTCNEYGTTERAVVRENLPWVN